MAGKVLVTWLRPAVQLKRHMCCKPVFLMYAHLPVADAVVASAPAPAFIISAPNLKARKPFLWRLGSKCSETLFLAFADV
jgi:hypothetical protein